MSVVSVVCCQAVDSAVGRSLVCVCVCVCTCLCVCECTRVCE